MSKITLLIVLILQVTTIQDYDLSDVFFYLKELLIFSIAVILGAGVRVMSKEKSRVPYTTKEKLIVFGLGFSLGGAVNYLLIYYRWAVPRLFIVGLVSFLAEFILIWIEDRYPKIFDGMLKKTTGIDVNNINSETIVEYKDTKEESFNEETFKDEK